MANEAPLALNGGTRALMCQQQVAAVQLSVVCIVLMLQLRPVQPIYSVAVLLYTLYQSAYLIDIVHALN
jgi:hypothetical protein